jgi:hypothetical protein
MKSNILSISISLVAIAFMSGCGSSDSTALDTSTAATQVTEAASAVYDVSGTDTYLSSDGKTINSERKISADGAFTTTSNVRGDGSVYADFILADNANQLVMTQITTIDTGSFDDANGKGTYTATRDLAKGTSHLVGTSDTNGAFDCVQTYDVGTMPKTIYSTENFWQFMYLDGFQKINTTCPAWLENNTNNDTAGNMESVTTSTVTDDTGRVSTVKIYSKDTIEGG